MTLAAAMFSTTTMEAAFDDPARVRAMIAVEAVLLRALASAGLAPASCMEPPAAWTTAELAFAELEARAAQAGNTAIPLVEQLEALARRDRPDVAGAVHLGATSQDVMDTGLVLQIGAALELLDADLKRLEAALADLARRHRDTPMAGRTWLQHALPTTFGLKAAGWLDGLKRAGDRVEAAGRGARVLQFGGAAGTLAALGEHGVAVADALAAELGLDRPPLPWHAQRERFVDLGCALGLLCGALGKMARDVSLLMQSDVAEVSEPSAPGRGGSSTMPHKRNPVGCAVALQAAVRAPGLVSTLLAAMPQEHERGLGGWQAEWETLPDLFRLAAGSLAAMAAVAEGLGVDVDRMRVNLDATHGLLMAEAVVGALAPSLGRAGAHAKLQALSRRAVDEGRPLSDVLLADDGIVELIGVDEIERRLHPESYLGSAGVFVDRVLEEHGDG